MSKSAVSKRARHGRLHRIHRAAYAVGHGRVTVEGRWMAAVLACGPGAVLSHLAAGACWGIGPDNRVQTDVSVPRRSARSRPGIVVHACAALRADEVTETDGIPCTTLPRTLLDLAEVLDRRGLERAIDRADVLRVFDLRALEDALTRAPGRRGAGLVRAALRAYQDPALTASEFEERFFAICRTAGVPRPEVNVWIALEDGHVKADFLWRPERLVVETDGWRSHGTRAAFVRDRARDRRLRLAGYDPYRFTWKEVKDRPAEVGSTLRRLLALAGERTRALREARRAA